MADAILVDANLLLWAHHAGFADHEPARAWWSSTLEHTPLVGIPWPTTLAFLRISTHPRVFERPLDIAQAWAVVTGWLGHANVRCPAAGEQHPSILEEMLLPARANGNHTTDAHLAALAVEWGLELQTADADFARYPGLRWTNPLMTG